MCVSFRRINRKTQCRGTYHLFVGHIYVSGKRGDSRRIPRVDSGGSAGPREVAQQSSQRADRLPALLQQRLRREAAENDSKRPQRLSA